MEGGGGGGEAGDKVRGEGGRRGWRRASRPCKMAQAGKGEQKEALWRLAGGKDGCRGGLRVAASSRTCGDVGGPGPV